MRLRTSALTSAAVTPGLSRITEPNRANPDGSIIYRSGLNLKIQRNFEVFTPCDFIAAITQHIPDKSFQLVRYH